MIQTTGDDAWEDLKHHTENTWSALGESFSKQN
jgi:hypothetical protein